MSGEINVEKLRKMERNDRMTMSSNIDIDEILFSDIAKYKPVQAYLKGLSEGYDMGWKAAVNSMLLILTNRYYTGLSEETTKLIEKIIIATHLHA